MSVGKVAVEEAIRDAGGNLTEAARKLGVARKTLQNRMRAYGMPRGRAGRPKRKIKYGRSARNFAVVATVAVVVGGVLLTQRKSIA